MSYRLNIDMVKFSKNKEICNMKQKVFFKLLCFFCPNLLFIIFVTSSLSYFLFIKTENICHTLLNFCSQFHSFYFISKLLNSLFCRLSSFYKICQSITPAIYLHNFIDVICTLFPLLIPYLPHSTFTL